METTFYSLGNAEYALQVRAKEVSETTQRLPTHTILLIDSSESMNDGNKLENVKHSTSMVLNFLGITDKMSIVTFGEAATVAAAAVSCAPASKPALEKIIADIHTDGCTNLSAGLLAVRRILEDQDASEAAPALKTGLLILTDGHANRGDSSAPGLQRIVAQLHERWPGLTIQIVGYGTDHNAELLKGMAEQTQGAYSIVEHREGAATVIGDLLGSLFSCAAQQVVVRVPGGLRPVGTQFMLTVNNEIAVGDVYEGGETLILLRAEAAGGGGGSVTVDGYLLPSLEAYRAVCPLVDAVTVVPEALQDQITMTRMRYACAGFFRELRESPEVSRIDAIRAEVSAMEVTLAVERFIGNAVASMLVAECASLRKAMDALTNPRMRDPAALFRRMAAHEAFTSLGRGTTRAIDSDEEEPPAWVGRRVGFRGLGGLSAAAAGPTDPAPLAGYMTSPYQGRTARRVTNLMTSLSSMDPRDAETVRSAAAEASQYSGAAPEPGTTEPSGAGAAGAAGAHS